MNQHKRHKMENMIKWIASVTWEQYVYVCVQNWVYKTLTNKRKQLLLLQFDYKAYKLNNVHSQALRKHLLCVRCVSKRLCKMSFKLRRKTVHCSTFTNKSNLGLAVTTRRKKSFFNFFLFLLSVTSYILSGFQMLHKIRHLRCFNLNWQNEIDQFIFTRIWGTGKQPQMKVK